MRKLITLEGETKPPGIFLWAWQSAFGPFQALILASLIQTVGKIQFRKGIIVRKVVATRNIRRECPNGLNLLIMGVHNIEWADILLENQNGCNHGLRTLRHHYTLFLLWLVMNSLHFRMLSKLPTSTTSLMQANANRL